MFRKIEEKDLDTLEKIDSVSHPWYWLKPRFREILQHEEEQAYVCEFGGQLLGYIVLCIVDDFAEVLNIAIKLQARSHGLAEMMMVFCCMYCKQNMVKQIYLNVRENNKVAINLYKRIGFKVLGKRHRYYVNLFFSEGYEDSIAMVKDIF